MPYRMTTTALLTGVGRPPAFDGFRPVATVELGKGPTPSRYLTLELPSYQTRVRRPHCTTGDVICYPSSNTPEVNSIRTVTRNWPHVATPAEAC